MRIVIIVNIARYQCGSEAEISLSGALRVLAAAAARSLVVALPAPLLGLIVLAGTELACVFARRRLVRLG